ncbi:MAG: hypothetical protein LQ339_007479 [Xanthoria mediterranea]|nr:MAG: hypothetical protein LQ339_007479 [Xanthoria mediterranea]
MKPLLLHGHTAGPNPYKVRLVLEYLQLPYEHKIWVLGDGPNGVKSAEFLKINENGRVPALEDPNTGVVSWESQAVINYLLRVYDKSHTLSPGPDASEQERVDYDKWTAFLTTTFGPMMGQRNWYVHFNGSDNPDAKKRYEEQCLRCFGVLEGQLAKSDGKSVLPSGFSAVDCHFWPWLRQYGFAQLDVSKYTMFLKWFKGIEGRPEVKRIDERIAKEKEAQGIHGM